MSKNSKHFLVIASFMMALSISIGAFGAHGLKAYVDESLMNIFHTGVSYQFYNTLGLFAIAFILHLNPNSKKIFVAGYLIFMGSLIFSFSLYLLVILKLPILGAVTPIGGSLMIIGWLLVTYTLIKDIRVASN